MIDKYALIDFGNFPIYNIISGLGFICALFLFMYNLNNRLSEEKKDEVLKIFAFSFLIAVISANFLNWYVIPGVLNYSFLDRFRVAGFTFYFGLIPFFLSSIIFLRLFKFEPGKIYNFIVPSILLFHAFGRIGCSLGGCCYGKIINFNFFNILTIEKFPAREMEAVILFILFAIAQFRIKEKRLIFYLYTYPIIRFLLEFGRGDIRGKLFTNFLSPSQEISLIILTITTIYILITRTTSLKQTRFHI